MRSVGPALGEAQEVGGQGVGRRRVEVLGRLVEDQDGEVGQQGAGHGHPLALAARKAGARPAPTRVSRPAGSPASQSARPDARRGLGQLVVGASRQPDAQVLGQRGVEEVGVLFHQPDHTPHVVPPSGAREAGPSSVAVAGVDGQEAHQHVGQGRALPPPLGPTRATLPSGLEGQVDAPQRGAARTCVRGPHAAQDHGVGTVTELDQ